MKYKIDIINKVEFPEVVKVWEDSVRATHHFLKEEDIEYFRPLILNKYLNAVELRCVKNVKNEIVGFVGVVDQNLEMLFIRPDYHGKGVGKILLNYSIENMNVIRVDVNEQNEQAIGFYQYGGFEIMGRSELDSSQKPYPILHMELKCL